jgi:hypothetical protein
MLLQHQIVSRKTPADGRLEILPDTAGRIAELDRDFTVHGAGPAAPGRLETMKCTCGKRAAGEHLHHFLASDALRMLRAGSAVAISLDPQRAVVHIRPATAPNSGPRDPDAD